MTARVIGTEVRLGLHDTTASDGAPLAGDEKTPEDLPRDDAGIALEEGARQQFGRVRESRFHTRDGTAGQPCSARLVY
jgi:hypothetical protein